jgi:DNA-binding NtrC family response regulator
MSFSQKESNRRVLIVDDEADVLDFLRIFLESLGWKVSMAASSTDAMRELAAQPCFLVITDIAMPAMDGYELIMKIKEQGFPCEFAVMTGFGYNPEHTLVKINKTLKYPYLFKPFNRKKVEETANNAYQAYHAGLTNG